MRGIYARHQGALPFALALIFVTIAASGGWAEGAAFASPIESSAQGLPPMRRFALVMGANGGGEGRVKLRYAASDARSFAGLLEELGGVQAEDLVLVLEPGLSSFRGAVDRLRAVAAAANAAGQRCEFVLYYSGHSDEGGLLLGHEKLGYSDLRAAIERVPAAVRVAIIDSCSSGSLTRAKGGSARPAFLFDASTDMEGHAYITSSSEAEAAQESDKIGGSFFTHYLVSALRGAADTDGKGKVTLNEAYAYAFRETLASTENTQYGPQHPAYEISLNGSGDLVLTDLRSSRAGFALDEDIAGSIYVRDAKGNLAVELDKEAGSPMEIGLPPGKYAVSLIRSGDHFQADLVVPTSGRARLSPGDFRSVVTEASVARGLEVVPASRPTVRNTTLAGVPVSFDLTVMPDFSSGLFFSQEDRTLSFGMLWGSGRDVQGVQMSPILNADSGDLLGFQFAFGVNAVQGRASGLQMASFVNVALGGLGGAQVSEICNWSGGEGVGGQLGLVNVADGLSGVQIGLVNVADHIIGVPIGLVNIARRIDGVPVGLVNIEEGGVFMPQTWLEEGSRLRLGCAFGTRTIYNLVSCGADIEENVGLVRPSLGVGLGGRVTLGAFFGDIDAVWREIWLTGVDPSARLSGRIAFGYPSSNKTGLFIGLALEGFMPGLSREDDGSAVSSFRIDPRFMFGVKL